MIIYEAPHKLLNTLKDIEKIMPQRKIVLAKELTKIYEKFERGIASQLLEKLENPKGEFIVVIEGNENLKEGKVNLLNELTLEEHYKHYEKDGLEKKEIIKQIAKDRNVNKNEIYKEFIKKEEKKYLIK